MQRVLTKEDQAEAKIVRELLATMSDQEKKIFRAFLKTKSISQDIKKYKKYD